MDNNQFQKNVYQVPTTLRGESLSRETTPIANEMSQAEVDQRFSTIAREEILQAFRQMTQGLDDETQNLPTVELAPPHPAALELLHIARDLQERRARHLTSLLKRVEEMGIIGRTKVRLTEKNAATILNPTIEAIIDEESNLGVDLFEHDPDVTSIKYFLHDNEWFHEQHSAIPEKRFTNKYEVTESAILKSSSFFNQQIGSVVTRTVLVDEAEARNLLIASKKYYEKVTGTVYVKSPAPRFSFVSKNSSKNK